MVTLEDMPDYPLDLQQAVDRMLADLGAGNSLMTYRAIKDCFGISRATVARSSRAWRSLAASCCSPRNAGTKATSASLPARDARAANAR